MNESIVNKANAQKTIIKEVLEKNTKELHRGGQ